MKTFVLLLPCSPTDTFMFYFSHLLSSTFLFLLFLSLAFIIMCLFLNIVMYEKILWLRKELFYTGELMGGATAMGSRRYLNSTPKVLDSRKWCRNTQCQAFILLRFLFFVKKK